LQALVTLNDTVYDEAAAALAMRTVKDAVSGGEASFNRAALDDYLIYETRLVLSRDPSSQELTILRELFDKVAKTSGPATLRQASLKLGGARTAQTGVNPSDFEALKAVGSVLLNLDAALTR
jgi:hypothetical protein